MRLAQVLKPRSRRRRVRGTRQVVWGTARAIAAVLGGTGTGTGINTASLERRHKTVRAAVCPLVGRGRALVRGERVWTGWMDLVGCSDNFGGEPNSLRIAAEPEVRLRW